MLSYRDGMGWEGNGYGWWMYILHSDYVCCLHCMAMEILVRWWREIYEFRTFSHSFGTHITSQPVRFARPAVRALCSTLGTRKCCWVYRASHAEFRDGWRWHADPSTHRHQSEAALCRWTRRRSARGVLLEKKLLAKWKSVPENCCALKLKSIFGARGKIKNLIEFCIAKWQKSLEARRSA